MEKQIDIQALKPVNSTEEAVIKNLNNRERFRRETNLAGYQSLLLRKGEKIVDDEFLALWKKWDTMGLGSIVYGRKGNPTRFKWNYNLKWVANAANAAVKGEDAGEPEILPASIVKKGRGRPKGSKNKRRAVMAPRSTQDKKPALSTSTAALELVIKLAKDAQELLKTIKQDAKV